MISSYKHLVSYALERGACLSVWDGEEWQVSKSTDRAAIIAAIESVDEAEIVVRLGGARVGWALIVPALDVDEQVADMTENEWMGAWQKAYGA